MSRGDSWPVYGTVNAAGNEFVDSPLQGVAYF